jgi:hypothetical protein
MKDMTPVSKKRLLRENAYRYYEATIYPANDFEFDATNMGPRNALNAELARIAKRPELIGW